MTDGAGPPPDERFLPRLEPEVIASAVGRLADRVEAPEVRAQLHALAGIVRNLVAPAPAPGLEDTYAGLEDAHSGLATAPDEPAAVLDALRVLIGRERVTLRAVDWTAASGG
jgi:hypothetical protein